MQKRLAIDQGQNILDKKAEGCGVNEPFPASLRDKDWSELGRSREGGGGG